MRFIKTTILVLLSTAFFFLAIVSLLAGLMSLNLQFTSMIIHWINRVNMPLAFIAGGLLFFLLSVVFFSLSGRPPDTAATFTFESDKGPINISLRAIEDYISKYFAERPVVNSVRTRVATTRDQKSLRVRASISVWSEQNLKTAGESVQKEIANCLHTGLGLDNIAEILISVDKIIASKTHKATTQKDSGHEQS
ncbi:MAG: hypothetical protein Kow0099_23970 [Candidatus Abyssubacteria bacterium]